ncbi:hypothetical protein QM012_002959 [Aureobasidium pullulans]|uniref:NAD(P)-binding protein n=1 Tax=Aureobasidium pullulans TaxID=5580 RepID=A0ABR0TA97_AURPU
MAGLPRTKPLIILITGANRGIGFCIAQALTQKNAKDTVIVTARVQDSASQAIQKLKEAGAQSHLDSTALDITSDQSIQALVSMIHERYGRLDVLINNAGIAMVPNPDLSDFRQVNNSILDTNITSVGFATTLLLPLLLKSQNPKVINISSGRASITRLTSGDLPATVSVPYSVSKVALNVMTLEMAKAEPKVTFYLANPGHCKTAFNGYKGKKDPLLGAEVAANLVHGDYKSGFWHNDGGEMEMMPCWASTTSDIFLFQLLKPILRATESSDSPSRVVSVSSAGHKAAGIFFDDLDLSKQGYNPMLAYAQSKTAKIYLANPFDRRYGQSGLRAVSVHPGTIFTTQIGRPMSAEELEQLAPMAPFARSAEQGAATTIFAALSSHSVKEGGIYLADAGVSAAAAEDEPFAGPGYAPHAYDEESEEKLWKLSLAAVGLEGNRD